MGQFIDGKWVVEVVNPSTKDGEFQRVESGFRDFISTDPKARFSVEPDRYHLYVSLACPWAHRALIYRNIKQLEALISVSVVHPLMGDQGWSFEKGPGVISDTVHQKPFLQDLYVLADPHFTGRVTVPVLWDKKENTIVNNESSEIIRMFNSVFDELTGNSLDFYPKELSDQIDEINGWVYDRINNGVYKAGFARDQTVYEDHVRALFEALDTLEERLRSQPFLCGDQVTEADWRLFPTLFRFDPVYVGHFKCNLKRILDYPNLSAYLKRLYDYLGVKDTCNLDHIKQHYYVSHLSLNPTGIVPLGPFLEWG